MKTSPTKPKGKAGRPALLEPDKKTLTTLEGCAEVLCTIEDAACVLGVHRSTLHEFLQRHPVAREAWDYGMGKARHSLRVKQMALATTNATMAIFLGKQLLGQRDQMSLEHSAPGGEPLSLKVQLELVGGPSPTVQKP